MSENEGDCWILICVLLSVIVNVKRTACCVWTNEIDEDLMSRWRPNQK